MKVGDVVGKCIEQSPVEPTPPGQRIEQQGLIETPHHDDPVERLAFGRKADSAYRTPGEPGDCEIKARCGPPVQQQFGLASPPPQLHRRKIEIREPDRALQLVGMIAGEKDERDVGFDDFDPLDHGIVGGRICEEGDGLPLPLVLRGAEP
ncbi:MAG TPA: hypothetical protein VME45_03250 [Stellaceae bacterium]|nr:hypothetical protein [Stellaceae bacterium]